jgi:hypothetical protein
LGDPLIVQEAPQALFCDNLAGIERHGAGNLAQLRRDTLGDADQHQSQGAS